MAEQVIIELQARPGGPWTLVGPPVRPDRPPGSFTSHGIRLSDEPAYYVFGWHKGQGPYLWEVLRGDMHNDPDMNPDGTGNATLIEAGLVAVADLRTEPATVNIRVCGGGEATIRLTYRRA